MTPFDISGVLKISFEESFDKTKSLDIINELSSNELFMELTDCNE